MYSWLKKWPRASGQVNWISSDEHEADRSLASFDLLVKDTVRLKKRLS